MHPLIQQHGAKVGWAAVGSVLTIAVSFIAPLEGLSTHPYKDAVGVLTVCIGATAADGVDLGHAYTPAECGAMLAADLPKYDAAIHRCIHVQLPPHREAALISFAYNLGPAALCRSYIARGLNSGDTAGACRAMLMYNHAGGRVLAGLTRRRQLEQKWCMRDD